jgi:FkbM family methyltransferase
MNIIEIGANDGSDTIKYSKYANIWCFEPVPECINHLIQLFKNNPKVKIIGKAVSDFDGSAVLNISNGGAGSSSLYELSEFSVKNKLIEYQNQIIVDVIRMDTFLDENNISTIDYFYCDAQGNDLNVLKSFGEKISIIKQGKVEVSLKEDLYKNATNNIEMVADFLTSNGFVISNWKEIRSIKWYDYDVIFYKKTNSKSLI